MAQDRSNNLLDISNLWMGNDFFYGSTQIQGETRLAFNTRCTQGNCIDRRKGVAVWGEGGDAGKVYAQMVLQKDTTGDVLLRLIDGTGAGVQLQRYDPTGDTWIDIGTNIGDADDRIDWDWTFAIIGDEERVYFTNGVSNLHYTNGTSVTEVTGIKGRYIATQGATLVMGCMTETYPANSFVYSYSGTHTFYDTSDPDETYETSSFEAKVDGVITGIKCFNWMVYVFTESDGLFEVDISGLPEPRKISTHGCMSPKSIAIGEDAMFWADQYGVWSMPASGDITKISRSVDKIYKQVSGSNFYDMAGGINTNSQYELHLGDLTFEGTDYSDVALVYEIEQSRFFGRNVWRVDTDKFHANNIVTWANAYGFLTTFYGSRLTQTVYQTDYGYADVDANIDMTWQSKDFPLADDKSEVTVEDIYLRFEPIGDETNIVVSCRMDTGTWVEVKDQELPLSSKSLETIRIQAPMGLTGRTFAVKVESSAQAETRIRNILVTYSHNRSERRL